jgi:hypothetical protein
MRNHRGSLGKLWRRIEKHQLKLRKSLKPRMKNEFALYFIIFLFKFQTTHTYKMRKENQDTLAKMLTKEFIHPKGELLLDEGLTVLQCCNDVNNVASAVVNN